MNASLAIRSIETGDQPIGIRRKGKLADSMRDCRAMESADIGAAIRL
jgi:hypothetical protein